MPVFKKMNMVKNMSRKHQHQKEKVAKKNTLDALGFLSLILWAAACGKAKEIVKSRPNVQTPGSTHSSIAGSSVLSCCFFLNTVKSFVWSLVTGRLS
jgi:hypothetical protein